MNIAELVKAAIAENQEWLAEHNAIKAILTLLEGKPINFRTLTPKRLNGFTLKHNNGWFYIVGKYEHPINCGSSKSVISVSEFERADSCYGKGTIERLAKLEVLDIARLQVLMDEIESTYKKLQELCGNIESENFTAFHNPIFYPMINELFQGEKNQSSKLSAFSNLFLR